MNVTINTNNKETAVNIVAQYEFFVEEWQDEYGPLPEDYVPSINSQDFKNWLKEQ